MGPLQEGCTVHISEGQLEKSEGEKSTDLQALFRFAVEF